MGRHPLSDWLLNDKSSKMIKKWYFKYGVPFFFGKKKVTI